MRRFFKDNGLSLTFLGLFVLCLTGQILTGYALQAEDPAGQSRSTSLFAYLADPSFLKGVFGNWQAALLQLLLLVVLSVFLRQKGAAHSRKPEDEAAPSHVDRLRWFGHSRSWAYAHSLSLTFAALFVLAFAAFFLADAADYAARRARLGEPPFSLAATFTSAEFWFQTFQTWQAEAFAMGAFLLLSVVLRQQDSAESKPVDADDAQTGDTNP